MTDGIAEDLRAAERRFWHTDIYELRDGRWQVVWSQATRIPAMTERQRP